MRGTGYMSKFIRLAKESSQFSDFNNRNKLLTLRMLITTIVALGGGRRGGGGSVDSKACQTYYIPHATIQSKCSHTGVNLLSYKHATFH